MRIWVTGVGIVSPLAHTARATMHELCLGTPAFGPVTLFDVSDQRTKVAAEVRDLRMGGILPSGIHGSRTDALAVAAAREAMRDAKLAPGPIDLVLGTTTGATLETETDLPKLLDDPAPQNLSPQIVHPLALTLDNVALALGPVRRKRLVSSACSTGANALLLAASWIVAGLSTRVVAGASDALCRLTFTGFNALASLDANPCRPFDVTRAGLGLGEGAAFLVLERDDLARARGVDPIAELAGWAAGAEAHHITNPEAEGTVASDTMRRALQVAAIDPGEVDYVNAHGTATLLNDPMEVRAIRRVFGGSFDRVAVSSIKGQIGHSLGAAGAVEAAVTALAIQQQRVPPTGGLTTPAEDCTANHVIGTARDLPLRAALSTSFGFGGLDGVVVFTQPGHAPDRRSPCTSVWIRDGAVAQSDRIVTIEDEPIEPSLPRGAVDDTVLATLDSSKSRRLARPEKLLVSVAGRMVPAPVSAGIIVGKPSGNPEATSRFLDRVVKRGPRFASPADFPNLMLSSLAGHASIYLGLQGPSLATSSQRGSGASSLLTAVELLASGSASTLVAGAVDPWGMVSRALGDDRVEGAAALLLAIDPAGGVAKLTPVVMHDGPLSIDDLSSIPKPLDRSRVVHTRGFDATAFSGSAWSEVPFALAEDWFGTNDTIGIATVVIAAAWISSDAADRVLVAIDADGASMVACVDRP